MRQFGEAAFAALGWIIENCALVSAAAIFIAPIALCLWFWFWVLA